MAKSDRDTESSDVFTAELEHLNNNFHQRKQKDTISVKTMLAYSAVFVLTTAAFVRYFTAGVDTPWSNAGGALGHRGPPKGIEWKSIKYSVVEGYFKQDMEETDQFAFDYVCLTVHLSRWSLRLFLCVVVPAYFFGY